MREIFPDIDLNHDLWEALTAQYCAPEVIENVCEGVDRCTQMVEVGGVFYFLTFTAEDGSPDAIERCEVRSCEAR